MNFISENIKAYIQVSHEYPGIIIWWIIAGVIAILSYIAVKLSFFTNYSQKILSPSDQKIIHKFSSFVLAVFSSIVLTILGIYIYEANNKNTCPDAMCGLGQVPMIIVFFIGLVATLTVIIYDLLSKRFK